MNSCTDVALLLLKKSSIYQSHSDIFDAISDLRFLISPATTSSEEELTEYSVGDDAKRFGSLECVKERLKDVCDQQGIDSGSYQLESCR